ncbi:ketosteroid isomerase family protein [Mycolicibacterium rhodesiae]|uniref:Transporter n=1 Tax=Mycolicibacterium rhodesiae TaxID=36814 RepID=A0A1X0II53_MYCRH|nr:ketosteroid isomerase family protein [Mycolicibacterium rhodesiae]MCV7343964.1 transporter [Mycolicibacterium rhodesiae]ORB47168.1 transporter [Mycolicibacterium rhodesiae]
MAAPRATLIDVVDRSPLMAADHDRAGWVGLFTDDGRVEDPVGSRPHVGPVQIGRFYDTFIAPRRIVFRHEADIVSGATVIRDVVLDVGMGPAVTMHIPAVLRYDLRELTEDWRIERLRAYWELPAMMVQFARNGLAAVPQAVDLSHALIRNQRWRGTLGFASGFRGARFRGKRTVRGFLDAVTTGDQLRAWRALGPGALITRGEQNPVKFGAFVDELAGASWTKMIAAGSSVTASLGGPRAGVLIAELGTSGGAITRLRYFVE